MIKNAKPSGYYFYMNLNIWGDFQICISVPLSLHSAPQQLQSYISCFYWQVLFFNNWNQKFKYHLKMFQATLV